MEPTSPSKNNKRKRIDSESMSDDEQPLTPRRQYLSTENSPVYTRSDSCPFQTGLIDIHTLSKSPSQEKESSQTTQNNLSLPSLINHPNLIVDNTEEEGDEEDVEDDDDTAQFVHLDQIPDRTIGYNADPDSLREFDVLDEFDEPQEDEDEGGISGDHNGEEKTIQSSEKNDDDGGDSSYTDDTDIPEDELEAMLEEGLPEKFKGKRNKNTFNVNSESPYEEKEKIVLEELVHNHFDVLPEGWIQVTHHSGIPIYLHKSSRVCTLSKPYFLGPGSARKHEVPLSAIPCLQYQKALDQEAENIKKMEETQQQQQQENGIVPPHLIMPSARIETAQENKAAQSLNALQIRDYCRRLFRFKTIKVMRFKSWSDRRKYIKNRKQRKQVQRPTLPERTKLIKFPVQIPDNDGNGNSNRAKKEWIMNPNGKSYVCILHEYVQHALKKQPSYQFKELENAATPYAATVTISDMQYGVGYGPSKKQAKSEAAKATLEILIPEMRDKIEEDGRRASSNNAAGTGEFLPGQSGTTSNGSTGSVDGSISGGSGSNLLLGGNQANNKPKDHDTGLQFFDEVKIEDPRVAELCAKTTEPSPYAILLTCLQRNFGLGEMHIDYEMNTMRHQKHEFTMTVGRHTAKVICKNKRDGKQRASQAILQILHPHISSWGSLLRLYGNRSVKNVRVKKREEQEITALQSKAAVNAPNEAILEKLRTEMRRLKEMRAAVQPIGKFIPPHDITTCMPTQLNNVDI